jgi:hypothetical protein
VTSSLLPSSAKDEQAQQIVSSIGSGLEKLAGGDLTA